MMIENKGALLRMLAGGLFNELINLVLDQSRCIKQLASCVPVKNFCNDDALQSDSFQKEFI